MTAKIREKNAACRLLIAATLLAALVARAQSQTIQKWKTPDGTLYFGDRPPAGSRKIGEEGSNEPPASGKSLESEPRSAELERLSVDLSRERTEIEKALNDNAEHLEEIDKRTAEAGRAPDVVPAWMERQAGIKNEKAEALQELASQKHTALATIAGLWKRFDKLDARVKEAYGGKAPVWWRSTLSCPKCPSLSEVEDALQ